VISLPVEFTFAAEIEALQAFFWYETIKKGLGEDFKESVNLKIELLQQNTQAYSFIYKDIRSVELNLFLTISSTEFLCKNSDHCSISSFKKSA
jgi:hypothetical protein